MTDRDSALPVDASDEQTFERRIEWSPAYSTEENVRHGMEARFVLIGPKGAVQFLLFTGFYHSRDRDDFAQRGGVIGIDGRRYGVHYAMMASAADLGFHAREPQYDGQPGRECPYLDGATCYYDGSGLNAEDAFDVFTDEGDEALWKLLRDYYEATFNDGPFPDAIGRRWARAIDRTTPSAPTREG